MTPAEHHAAVAGVFSARVDGVRDWEAPAPVAGWVAQDVVAHLVGWLPGFLAGGGVELQGERLAVGDDPVGAWHAHAAAVQRLLESGAAGREFNHPQVGTHQLGAAVDQFYTADVFLHTWTSPARPGRTTGSTLNY